MNTLKSFFDKRKRKWEVFIDSGYYDMVCVKPVDEKSFNSQFSFHFDDVNKAMVFASLIEKSR